MRLIAAVIGLFVLAPSLQAAEEELSRETKPFLVRYKDGTAERYVGEWRGIVSWDTWRRCAA